MTDGCRVSCCLVVMMVAGPGNLFPLMYKAPMFSRIIRATKATRKNEKKFVIVSLSQLGKRKTKKVFSLGCRNLVAGLLICPSLLEGLLPDQSQD